MGARGFTLYKMDTFALLQNFAPMHQPNRQTNISLLAKANHQQNPPNKQNCLQIGGQAKGKNCIAFVGQALKIGDKKYIIFLWFFKKAKCHLCHFRGILVQKSI